MRDVGLLGSALAMPQASFQGTLLHASLAEMAAALLFHVARNHRFIDGNKRTTLACALAFLWLNGQWLEAGEDELAGLVMGLAAGRRGRPARREEAHLHTRGSGHASATGQPTGSPGRR